MEEKESQNIPSIKSKKRKLSTPYIIGIVLVVALIIYLLIPSETTDIEETKETGIAATINGKVVTVEELNDIYDNIPENQKVFLNREQILEQMIEMEVLVQEANKREIYVSEEEAKQALENAKQSQGMTDEQFKEEIERRGITEQELLSQYKDQLKVKELINISVLSKIEISDEEIKKYYNENKEQFKVPEQVTVKHVLIGDEELSVEEKEAKAKSLLNEITKENFCEYVEEYSTDTASIPTCGEYTFSQQDPLVEEFKKLSFEQKPGEIGTTNTQFGTHIILTIKKTAPRTIPLSEASENIKTSFEAQIGQQLYDEFYNGLIENNEIEVLFVETASSQNQEVQTLQLS